jgi:4-amino-4-deoxy-L-arabinose transferase-like glycosyltransferase
VEAVVGRAIGLIVPSAWDAGVMCLRGRYGRLVTVRFMTLFASSPRWIRWALPLLAAVAGLLYAWRLGANGLHPFYAPAVKSMSVSWRAFFYGGYDPTASITLDKLPGAFMVQALSARVFGFHVWSVLLPQLLASVATVLVLYVVVARWQGPVAGFAAAAIYASTPIVAAMARAEVSDTILVLLLVLAAEAWQRATTTGRLRLLVLCGVWVGLAFQTKMVQAWGVLPAFALVYLFSAPIGLRKRLGHVAVAGLTTLAVSMWWIAMVMLTPAASRPYIDGTTDGSRTGAVLEMVFKYNLFDRYAEERGPGPVWWYMFGDGTAPQVGWLYPMALAGLVFSLWWRGRAPRTDPVRAGFLMWGLWLLVHAAAFSAGEVAHVFYVIAVAPPIAALAAGGGVTLWKAYRAVDPQSPQWRRWVLPATTAVTAGWAYYLSQRFPEFLPWMASVVVGAGAVATVILVAVLVWRDTRWLRIAAVVTTIVAVLLAPAAWAASTVDSRYQGDAIGPAAGVGGDMAVGPGGGRKKAPTPGPAPAQQGAGGLKQSFQGPSADASGNNGPAAAKGPGGGDGSRGPGGDGPMGDRPGLAAQQLLSYLRSQRYGERYLVAAPGGGSGGELLLSGEAILAMGGFSGLMASPSTDRLAAMVATHELRFVLLGLNRPSAPGGVNDWVTSHCHAVESQNLNGDPLYDCRPAS